MTTRGRKPQPAAVKRAKGNPGRRRVIDDAVVEEKQAARLAPPDEISEGARKVWNLVVPHMSRAKLARAIDTGALWQYCEYFALWVECLIAVRKDGRTYWTETNHGKMRRKNPDYLQMLDMGDKTLKLAQEFGLTPASRQQILHRMAAVPPAAPAGDLFEDKDAGGQQPAGSPLGLLNNGGAVH